MFRNMLGNILEHTNHINSWELKCLLPYQSYGWIIKICARKSKQLTAQNDYAVWTLSTTLCGKYPVLGKSSCTVMVDHNNTWIIITMGTIIISNNDWDITISKDTAIYSWFIVSFPMARIISPRQRSAWLWVDMKVLEPRLWAWKSRFPLG